MIDNNVLIRLRADGAAQVRSEVGGVEASIDRLRGSFTTAAHYGAGLAAAFGLVIPAIGGTVRAMLDSADAATSLQNKLRLAAGGTEAATQAYEALFSMAQRSRVGFIELGDTFASISRAGDSLGITQDRLLNVTEAIANAMTISGGSAQSLRAALVQLGQGLSAGALRGEELNSVMEQAPRLAKALADGLGVPIGKLREMGAAGEISAKQVIEALESAAPQLAAEVQSATLTVGQAFTVLSNSAVKFTGDADRATDATAGLASAIVSISSAIDGLRSSVAVMDGLRTVAEALKVLWSDVAFVFSRTGAEIGAIGAQIAAILRGEFSQAAIIRAELIADSAKAREELDKYQAAVLNRTQGATNAAAEQEAARQQQSARAIRERAAAERDLSELMTRMSGVNAGYLKDMQEVIRLNRAGVLVGEQYVEALGLMQSRLLKTPSVAREHAQALREAEVAAKRGEDAYRRYVLALYERSLAQANEEWNERRAAIEAVTNAQEKALQALRDSAGSVEQQVAALRDEAEAATFAAAQNISLAEAIQLVAIARARERQEQLAREGDLGAASAEVEREIAARRELIRELRDKSGREAATEAARSAADDWQRAAADIEKALTDALVRGFEGGRSIVRSIGDYIVNFFKTTVARGIAQSITGALASAIPGVASASTGGLGSLLGGNYFSTGLDFALGGGNLFAGLGSAASLIGGGNVLGGLGAGLGTVAPYLAAAYAVYEIAKRIKDNGGSPAQQNFSMVGPGDVGYGRLATNLGSSSFFDEQLNQLSRSVADLARALGGSAGATTYGLFTSVSPDGRGGQTVANVMSGGANTFYFEQNGPNETVQARIAEQLPKMLLAGLQDANLDKVFSDYFKSIDLSTATQETVTAAIAAATSAREFATALGQLGGQFAGVAGLSVEAANAFAALLGGTQNAVQLISQYQANFLSAVEREAQARQQIGAALAEVNLVMPETREQFRALVEAQDLTTEAGQKNFAVLMQVSGAFAGLVPETVATAEAVEEVAQSMRSAADIAAERAGLERQLLTLEGDTAELRRRDLEALDESNRALQERIWAIEDERAALAELLTQSGISADSLASTIRDGLLGRATGEEAGAALAEQIEGGILNALAGGFASDITQTMMDGIIVPMLQAATTGASMAEAVSQQAIDAVVSRAQQAAAAIASAVSDPGFLAAMDAVRQAVAGITSVMAPAAQAGGGPMSVYSPIGPLTGGGGETQAEDNALRTLLNAGRQLEVELLRAQGRELDAVARQREIETEGLSELALAQYTANSAIRAQIAELQRAAGVEQERLQLERQLLQAQGDTAAIREVELAALDPANRALQERIWALQDVAEADRVAAQAAAERAAQEAAVAGERAGLERRILELTGDTAAIRALELAALDSSNRALQERIWALEDEAAAAAQAAAQAAAIAGERAGLERQLLELQGDTAALRALELAGLNESNRALQLQIWALQDQAQAAAEAARAAEAAARAEEQLANERESLERRLLELQGNTAALRARELAALDPANRALLEQIWALEDQRAAAEAAARALEEAAAAARVIADERYGLETRLLQLQGNTAALRERELAALDESNRAILEQIWALEDQAAAAEKARQAQEQLAQSAIDASEEQVSALRSIVDLINDQVADLLGLTGGMSAAAGREFIDQALATARTSGYLPDADELGAAIRAVRADMDSARYGSAFEADRARRLLANQLSDLGDLAEDQLTDAERMLEVAQAQLDALRGIEKALTDNSARAGSINGTALQSGQFVTSGQATGTQANAVDRLLAEMQLLINETRGLRSEVRATAQHTGATNRILDRVTRGGNALATEPAQ